MAYNHATRLDTLGTRMQELNSNTATYKRQGNNPITITNFTPEKVDVSQLALAGITLITEQALDVVFDASDLSSLTPATPQVGDKFVWGSSTYEVMNLGEETFNYTTASKTRMRVHLKL